MESAAEDKTLNIFANRIRREFAKLDGKLPSGVLLVNKSDGTTAPPRPPHALALAHFTARFR